jgi:hypothetical protein
MKYLTLSAAILVLFPILASAQDADHVYRLEGYGFAAYNVTQGPAGGGGGEVFLFKGLGVGGEYAKASSPNGEQTVSANLYYGLTSTRKHRIEPFVTGGSTLFFHPGLSFPSRGWSQLWWWRQFLADETCRPAPGVSGYARWSRFEHLARTGGHLLYRAQYHRHIPHGCDVPVGAIYR